MDFGRRLPQALTLRRGSHSLQLWGWTIAFFALVLAGCGGGSSSGGSGGGTNNTSNPLVTGRVVDRYSSSAPVAGAQITIRRGSGANLGTTTTDAGGNFSLRIPPTNETTFAVIAAPGNLPLYSTATANSADFNLSTGAEIPPLPRDGNYNLQIQVASETGGPPPPPF